MPGSTVPTRNIPMDARPLPNQALSVFPDVFELRTTFNAPPWQMKFVPLMLSPDIVILLL